METFCAPPLGQSSGGTEVQHNPDNHDFCFNRPRNKEKDHYISRWLEAGVPHFRRLPHPPPPRTRHAATTVCGDHHHSLADPNHWSTVSKWMAHDVMKLTVLRDPTKRTDSTKAPFIGRIRCKDARSGMTCGILVVNSLYTDLSH